VKEKAPHDVASMELFQQQNVTNVVKSGEGNIKGKFDTLE